MIRFSAGTAPPCFTPPPGAVDCHHHVYDPRWPMAPGTRPHAPATIADHAALLRRLGLARRVLVQPSTYGFDNRLHLAACAADRGNSRVVVVVPPDLSPVEARRLTLLGAVGARLNLLSPGTLMAADIPRLGALCAEAGWHLQIFADAATIAGQAAALRALPCDVVFDHYAALPPQGFAAHPAWRVVAGLLAAGHGWVKLSSPYALPSGDLAPLTAALLAENPARLVFGTNWPHPNAAAPPDDAALLDAVAARLPEEARRAVFVANAVRLYRF